MSPRTLRHRDGTVQTVYAGPNRRRRRPSAALLFILAGLLVVWLANHGGI